MAGGRAVEETRVRLVFLGAAGVGKTALIRRFLDGTFEPRYRRTVEELHVLDLPLSEPPGPALRLRLELLDTSGSYSFPAMRRLGIRGGDAFALVFAPHQAGSFEEVRRLRDEILEAKPGAAPLLVVAANKLDLAEGCGEPAAALADTVRRDWGARYVEASAKQGRNVGTLFRELLGQVEELSGRLSPALRRHRNPAPPARRPRPRPACSVS
ncbi:ras-related protein Rap-2a-like [Liasis olivaceus]